MDSFTQVPKSKALVRIKAGVFKELPVYYRGETTYVPHAGGYVRIGSQLGDGYVTSHSSIRVLEIEGKNIVEDRFGPKYQPAPVKSTHKARLKAVG